MLYKVIGLMSGSKGEGLDIAFVQLQETAGKWAYEILRADCVPYSIEWKQKIAGADQLPVRDYQLLHAAYGHYTGELVNKFIEDHSLHHQVHLIASHGHPVFHIPAQKMTAQLGDGAAVAAVTGLPVVSDLRAMDIALGGQGAPIEVIAEKLLLKEYNCLLTLDSKASLSFNLPDKYIAFDVSPVNSVLQLLAADERKAVVDTGGIAGTGKVNTVLLNALNGLEYNHRTFPKRLAVDFAIETIYPLFQQYQLSTADALRTYAEHIAQQIKFSIQSVMAKAAFTAGGAKLLVTGAGAFNSFLVECIRTQLQQLSMEIIVPDEQLINYKEALAIALMGVLRWREEYNMLSAATGAVRNSIGGALWLGGEA